MNNNLEEMDKKLIEKFDTAVYGYIDYQEEISYLYPGQFLDIVQNSEIEDIFLEYAGRKVGKLFYETAEELGPYMHDKNNYIECLVKKFYPKQGVKALVVIINVYEKGEGFKTPSRPFLGDYVTGRTEYVWGEVLEDEIPKYLPLQEIIYYRNLDQRIYEGESATLVLDEPSGRIVAYSEMGDRIGELSEKHSKLLRKPMSNPDKFIYSLFEKIKEKEPGVWSCSLEVAVYEKKTRKTENQESKPEPLPEKKKRGCFKNFFIALGVVFLGIILLFILLEIFIG